METILGRPFTGQKLGLLKAFLIDNALDYEEGIEFSVILMDNDQILATGSRQRNVLKCIAVSPSHQGGGLAARIITELVKQAMSENINHLFLYTSPWNRSLFSELGFYPITATDDALLMENRKNGIQNFVRALECPTVDGIIGCVVANANPFTNGHLYLIEQAAKRCDLLHVFVLSEDRSLFPAAVRLQLARKAAAGIKNVLVHPTGDYLISSATFPQYFLKDKAKAEQISCALDLAIFAEHFAKPLNITRRFVGTEPFCPVTASYNQQMIRYLPTVGIEVVELPRRIENDEAISASQVRRLMAGQNYDEIKKLVPPATFDYLVSEDGRKLAEILAASKN